MKLFGHLVLLLFIGACVTIIAQTPPVAPPVTPPVEVPQLPELERLKLENHVLKTRVLELEAQLRSLQLQTERQQLSDHIKNTLPGWQFNWQTGQLEKVATDKQP